MISLSTIGWKLSEILLIIASTKYPFPYILNEIVSFTCIDDPYHGSECNQQQSTPPSNANIFGLTKLTPPQIIVSNSQLSSVDVSTPPFVSSSLNSLDAAIPQATPHTTSLGSTKTTFTYEELLLATDNFSETNLLGQGGFGYVHKGVLHDGTDVAIKQLKVGSGQGEREFQAEVEIISRVHHNHLVSLLGHCISGSRRLLVYEYVPNQTLEFHLHGIRWIFLDYICTGFAVYEVLAVYMILFLILILRNMQLCFANFMDYDC